MASLPLVSTYKRYKADTEQLTNWLSSSAQRCHSHASPSRRESSTRHDPRRNSTADLVGFARVIVQSKNPIISIDVEILNVTRDVLTARSDCADFYTSLERADEQDSTEYKARCPPPSKEELHDGDNDLSNLYQHLELEDTLDGQETSIESSASDRTSITTETKRKPGQQPDNDLEERRPQIYCLLKDIAAIRQYVRDIWQQHLAGQMSILTATKATDCAAEMVNTLSDELVRAHPTLDSFGDIKALVHGSSRPVATTSDFSNLVARGPSRGDAEEANLETSLHDELLLAQAYQVARDFQNSAAPIFTSKNSEPASEKKTESTIVRPCHAFGTVLANLTYEFKAHFPRIHELTKQATSKSSQDMLESFDGYTKALVHVMTGDGIGLSFVLATQLLMEVYEVLGMDSSCVLEEAERVIRRCKVSASALQNFTESVPASGKHMVYPKSEGLAMLDQWVKLDQRHGEATGWRTKVPSDPGEGTFVPSSILAALPLFAANVAFGYQSCYQVVMTKICGDMATVLSSAYLYQAGRFRGTITEPWADMEMYIARQNSLGKFFRARDGNLRSMKALFGSALGMTISEANSDHFQLPRPEKMQYHGPMPQQPTVFDKMTFDEHMLERAIGTEYNSMRVCYEFVKRHASTAAGIHDAEIAKQWKLTGRLDPVQLLKVTLEVLTDDEPHLNFDTTGFYLQCVRWLIQVARLVGDDMAKRAGPSRESGLYFGYEAVFLTLVGAAEAEARHLRLPQGDDVVYQASLLANTLIKDHGDGCSRQSNDTSSKQLPAHLKSRLALSHVKYIDMPSDEDILEQLSSQTTQAEEELIHKAQEDFIKLVNHGDHGQDPVRVMHLLQSRLSKQFKKNKSLKQPILTFEDDLLKITTGRLAEKDVADVAQELKAHKEVLAMRTGLAFTCPAVRELSSAGREAQSACPD